MPRLRRRDLPVATVALARFLIGKRLVNAVGGRRIAGRIVETEAYPPGDPTGYARHGLTTSKDIVASRVLWLESGDTAGIVVSTRIGLSRDQHRRLRFLERGSPFVSYPP